MKRWMAITMILVSTALGCTVVWFIQHNYEKAKERLALSNEKAREQQAASQRQQIYESILQSYRASFRNGMTRAEVRDSLRTRSVQFGEICCLERGESETEITEIGFETGPWYCTGYEIYVGFHFSGPLASQNPKDILKKVSIESLPNGCV
jgi:hypothetical protein